MRLHALLALFALVPLLASGCGSDTGQPSPGGSPWKPTTHPFDPKCSSCIEIGGGEIAHIGKGHIMIDTATDDPPAQWTRCTLSFLRCLDKDFPIPQCIRESACPDVCKSAFEEALKDHEETAAVDATFFDAAAVCASPDEEAVSP